MDQSAILQRVKQGDLNVFGAIMDAHVRLRDDLRISETETVGHRLQHLLDERFEINHATFQFETGNGKELHCEHDHIPATTPQPHTHG